MDTAALRALGWREAVTMEEDLRRTVEWHLAHPPQEEPVDYAAEDAAA